jgi:hypothetical protein
VPAFRNPTASFHFHPHACPTLFQFIQPVLRAYLKRWTWEVGKFFGGVKADSPAEDLARIAPDHPVFRLGPP